LLVADHVTDDLLRLADNDVLPGRRIFVRAALTIGHATRLSARCQPPAADAPVFAA
jgi:hypothetical protein